MDDLECPRCKTTKYRCRDLKLMVNVCGHALCENCVELLFIKGSGSCPQCNIPLRRNNFRYQIFEDSTVEKELDIRRKILADFNKKEDDFRSLLDYNNYLEEIETIIFNLANNIEIEATKRKIDLYKKENQNLIRKNKGKQSKEEKDLEEFIENEQYEAKVRKQQVFTEEQEEKESRQKKKEALIDDLMFSDLPAKDIITSHSVDTVDAKPKVVVPTQKGVFSMGSKLQKQVYLPVPKQTNNNTFVYISSSFDNCGPPNFTPNTFRQNNFLQHVRNTEEAESASGYISDYACQRALDDALQGLFWTCTT